jgi:hypothetical protein
MRRDVEMFVERDSCQWIVSTVFPLEDRLNSYLFSRSRWQYRASITMESFSLNIYPQLNLRYELFSCSYKVTQMRYTAFYNAAGARQTRI